jgi:hypothetical protein
MLDNNDKKRSEIENDSRPTGRLQSLSKAVSQSNLGSKRPVSTNQWESRLEYDDSKLLRKDVSIDKLVQKAE